MPAWLQQSWLLPRNSPTIPTYMGNSKRELLFSTGYVLVQKFTNTHSLGMVCYVHAELHTFADVKL